MPRPDRSRAALVRSAGVLFRRQGYAATGLNQILDEAGVKAGSLYHHFPGGKQELAAAVVESAGANLEKLMRVALVNETPISTSLGLMIEVMITQLAADSRDGCPIEPIATESAHASELVREYSTRAFTSWCKTIEDRLIRDGWALADAKSTAISAISLFEGAIILSKTSRDPAALTAAKNALTRLLENRHTQHS